MRYCDFLPPFVSLWPSLHFGVRWLATAFQGLGSGPPVVKSRLREYNGKQVANARLFPRALPATVFREEL